MDLSALASALLRRWYLTTAALLATVGVTALMVMRTGPTCKAESAVLLFPPISSVRTATAAETQGNPYLVLGGLSQVRDILMRALRSKAAAESFSTRQPNAKYEIEQDFTTGAPIIVITVTSPSAEASIRGLNDVVQTVPEALVSLQSDIVGLPNTAYVTSRVLTTDTEPDVVRSDQVRSGIVAGAAALLGMLLLLAVVDGLLMTRGARRSPNVEAPDDGEAGQRHEESPAPLVGQRRTARERGRRVERVGR